MLIVQKVMGCTNQDLGRTCGSLKTTPKWKAFWRNSEHSYTRSDIFTWIKPLCMCNQLYKLNIGKLPRHIIFTQDLIKSLWKWGQENWIAAQIRLTRNLNNEYFMFFLRNLLIYCKKREKKPKCLTIIKFSLLVHHWNLDFAFIILSEGKSSGIFRSELWLPAPLEIDSIDEGQMSDSVKIPWGYQIFQQTYSGKDKQKKIHIKSKDERTSKDYQTTIWQSD